MAKRERNTDPGAEDISLHPWWWRTRYKMAPLYAAGSAIVLGLLSKAWADTTQVVILTVIVAGLLGMLVRARYGAGGAKKRRDPAMALFLYVVIGVYFGAILAIRSQLLPTGWLLISLVGITSVLGLFWWFDRRNLRTQEIEEELRRWPALAKKGGLGWARKKPTRITESGKITRFWWNRGDGTLESFQANARWLESALGIKHKRIRFIPVVDEDGFVDPNQIDVAENTQSKALKAPIPFDEPTMRTVYDRMLIGPLEDESDYHVVWYDRKWGGKHTLVGGASGSGKSGLYDLVLAESSKCMDVVRWGIDRKGGMTLTPWATLMDWLVTDEKGTEAMLVAIREVLERRSAYAASKGWKTWRASAKRPLIILIIDECAEVLGSTGAGWQNAEIANSIARMGRAAGVLLLLATQHPTTDALASTQLTKNLGRRFCFSVEDSGGQRAIIPGSTELFDATAIPLGPKHAGTYYTSEGGVISTLSGRVRYVTDEKIRELVTEIGDAVSELDAMSMAAAEDATTKYEESGYAARRRWLVEDLPPLDDDGTDDDDEDDIDDAEDEEPMPVAARATPDNVVMMRKQAPPSSVPEPEQPDDEDIENEEELPTMPTTSMSIAELAASIPEEERDRLIAEHLLANRDDPRVTTEEALRRLNAALNAAGPDGITVKELIKISGRKSTWVYDQLEELALRSEVDQTGFRGRYRRPAGWREPVAAGDLS